MASTLPISGLLGQISQTNLPGALYAQSSPATPLTSSVSAFQSAMNAPQSTHMVEDLFGTSAVENREVAKVHAPLLDLPDNIDYLTGTTKVLETILPKLPNQLPSPMDLLAAQLRISSVQLGWQFISKATGTAVQGVQTLVNSQV